MLTGSNEGKSFLGKGGTTGQYSVGRGQSISKGKPSESGGEKVRGIWV